MTHIKSSTLRLKFFGILCTFSAFLAGTSFAIAQQQQPQQPQQQPQNGQPQNQNQTGNNGQNGPQRPPSALDKAKADLQKTAPQAAPQNQLSIGDIVVPPAQVGDPVTFAAHVYDSRAANGTYMYALQGNPMGSYIDPNTGNFTWQPQYPGIFNFYVWTEDSSDIARQAFKQVSITVNPALQPFGYSIFFKARAVIDTRMLLVKSGLLQGVGAINNGQYGGNIPLTPQTNNPLVAPNVSQNIFNPAGNGTIFGQGPNAYLFGPGMNPNAAAASQYANQMNSQATQQGTNAQGQQQGQGQGQYQGQPQNQYLPNGQMMNPGFIPPLSPFGSLNNLYPSTPGGQGQGFGGQTGSPNQQLLQQYLQNGGAGGAGASYGQTQGLGQNMLGQGLAGQGQQVFPQNQVQGQGAGQGQGGFNLPSPTYQGFGNGTQGSMNSALPFASSGPTGLTITPSNAFSNLNGVMSMPGQGGLPSGQSGFVANALQYLVGPQEEMGMNVYLPYPERYQLGPGDALTARIWSDTIPVQYYDLTVDQQGRLMLPTDVEEIVVRGFTIAEAQAIMLKRVKKLFKSGQLLLTLKALRTMSVQILGDAYMPGTYQVPAVATLFNTLIVCGGPNDQGSLRKIQLRRNNKTTGTFDLYKYLTEGDMSADVPLQPGDVIFIPPVTARVNIKGEVERPAIYETVPGDSLKTLIKFAGGVTATSFPQRAELDTEAPGVGHIVKDANLLGSDTAMKLYDQDTINVYSLPLDVLDDLNLKGAVKEEGTYEYKSGITVSDLVREGGGLMPDAFTSRADLFRRNPDKTETLIPIELDKAMAGDLAANVALKPHDRLVTYHITDVKWKGVRTVTVLGAVQKPGVFERTDGETVSDLLLQAGGVVGQAFKDVAILQRTNPDGTAGPLVRVDLNRLASDPKMNVALADRDTLTVQSDQEAMYIPEQTVSILGAVQQPNVYTSAINMRLLDLIQEAGGLMPNAGKVIKIAHSRVPVSTPPTEVRISDLVSGSLNANVQLVAGDLVTIPEDALIQLQPRRIMVLGRVANPGAYPIAANEKLSDVIAKAGGLLPDAFKKGAQFYRQPMYLATDTQASITSDISKMLQIVAQDEYTRAQASADVEKVRLMQGGSQTSSIPLLGATGGSAAQTQTTGQVPLSIWNEQLVTVARDITSELQPTGNFNVNLTAALDHKGSFNDVELMDADIVLVPKTPSTVSVVGAVAVPSAVLFLPGHNVRYYLNRAGGPTEDAAKDRLILIHAGGLVQRAYMSTPMELGDQLLVPSKVQEAHLNSKAEELDQVSKEITAGVVLLAILRLL